MSERSAVILDGPLLIYRQSDGVVMNRSRVDLRTVSYLESGSVLESDVPKHVVRFDGNGWSRTLSLMSRDQIEIISKAWDDCRKAMGEGVTLCESS